MKVTPQSDGRLLVQCVVSPTDPDYRRWAQLAARLQARRQQQQQAAPAAVVVPVERVDDQGR